MLRKSITSILNIGTQGVQKLLFVCVCVCEWKDPGGSCTQWTLNSYDKVNPATFFGYDVQRKKKLEFVSL